MSQWDWSPYLVGGGTRADAMTGLNPAFGSALQQMFAAAPEQVRAQLRINSAYRSPEVQTRLWDEALAKYGSPEAARKWVAPPGRSQHNHGRAADLKYLSPEAKAWAHQNAAQYGLAFPMGHEPWHIELAGARDGAAPTLSFGPDVPQIDPNSLQGMFAPGQPAAAMPAAPAVPAAQAAEQASSRDAQAQALRRALAGMIKV